MRSGRGGKRGKVLHAPHAFPEDRGRDRQVVAPGMAAMMAGLGDRAPAVMQRLVDNLEVRLGTGPVSLSGVVFTGTARVL